MSDFKDSARARRGETVGEWQAIDVCHSLPVLPANGSTGKASGTQPGNECVTEHSFKTNIAGPPNLGEA